MMRRAVSVGKGLRHPSRNERDSEKDAFHGPAQSLYVMNLQVKASPVVAPTTETASVGQAVFSKAISPPGLTAMLLA